MKHLLFLLALVFTLPAFTQKVSEGDLPEAVLTSLTKSYPDLKVKEWQMLDGQYEARTRIEGATAFILFEPDGRLVKTSFPLDPKELPSALLNYVDKNFPGVNYSISDLVEDGNGQEYYFIELRKEGVGQGKLSELKFSPAGEMISRNDFQKADPVIETTAQDAPVRRTKKPKETEVIAEPEPITLDESKVPAAVKNNFARRFRMAEELVWDTLGGNYIASFFQGDLNSEVHFKPNGDWVLTKEEMAPDRVFAPVSRFLYEEYPGYKLEYAEKISKADRDVNYYIEVSERVKGIEPDPITRLYFDKSGRVTEVEEPVLPEEVVTEVDYLHDPRFDKKLEKELEQLEAAPEQNAAIKESELPSGITTYIYDKYPDIKIRESVLDQDPEWGSVYRVVVSKEGLMQESYDLFFDRKGKMLADNVPADFSKRKEKEKPAAQEDEPYYEDRTTVASTNVPDVVTTGFSRRFPRAQEVEWSEDDKGYFTAKFIDRDLLNQTTYDKSGKLLRTKTEMTLDRVYRPALLYIEENYPKYKIDYAEKIVRTDRILYYYVELYTNKKGLAPNQYLFFDKMGKPLDEEPEL
jgi:hypothetical protein